MSYQDEDELTGYEEHLRDAASECGEIAAMREEAERDIRNFYEGEEIYRIQMWEEQQADPFRSVCEHYYAPLCVMGSVGLFGFPDVPF